MKIARGIGPLMYTIAIYIGLPLFGWGLDDPPGFFSYPQLIGYSIIIAAFGLLVSYMAQRPGGLGTRDKGREDKFVPRQRIVRILVTGMLFCALIFVPFADRRSIGVMASDSLTFVVVVIVLFRIKEEEALMSSEFGETWQQYCKKSWQLMPFIF